MNGIFLMGGDGSIVPQEFSAQFAMDGEDVSVEIFVQSIDAGGEVEMMLLGSANGMDWMAMQEMQKFYDCGMQLLNLKGWQHPILRLVLAMRQSEGKRARLGFVVRT